VNSAVCVRATCLGHALPVDSAGFGVVHSVFARAVNLTVRGELWTLLAEDRADLPLGIRVPFSNFERLDLRRGEPVHARARFVGVGSRLVIDCRTTARWVPRSPPKPEPGLERRLAFLAAAIRGRSWHASACMARTLRFALDNPTSLGKVVAQVVGCGPGTTPSGDDVLVGALGVLTSPHAGGAGARAAEALRRALLPVLQTTTDLSAHLLRQASLGLFGRDLHDLIAAILLDVGQAGSPSHELGEKIRRVLDTGATSGADLCEGLLAFAPFFFTTSNQRGLP
jgi:Protein of unknown function (DUF2877)